MRFLVLLVLLLPAPARALEICDELWFTRNLVYDRAGYCFGSALGKAVFETAECEPVTVELADADVEIVDRILKMEAEFECEVDIRQDFLAVPQLTLRKTVTDVPFPMDQEKTCVGWKGERLPLLTARSDDAEVAGAARPGDKLLSQFEPVDGWAFVEVYQNDTPAGAGWSKAEIGEASCTAFAG